MEQGAKVMLDNFGPCSLSQAYEPTNKVCFVRERAATQMRMVGYESFTHVYEDLGT